MAFRFFQEKKYVFALCAGLLAGCAHSPPTIYQWGNYQDDIYRHFRGEGPGRQLQDLESDYQKMQATHHTPPPGFYAYLGMLYAETGNDTKAREYLTAEKTQYPESTKYINLLLKNYK